MLNILTSGLPLQSINLLVDASKEMYGEGISEVVILDKDNLRQRVRLSTRNVQDVLVILDTVSQDICKDIEGGLYSSDKFYSYTDEEGLVEFLNGKYGLDLKVVSSSMEISGSIDSSVNADLLEKYETQIADKDLLINNLNARIMELTSLIELGGYESEDIESTGELADLKEKYASLEEGYEKLKQESLELHNQILNKSSECKSSSEELLSLRKERDNLKNLTEKLEEKRNSVISEMSSISAELTDYKVKYSMQSGLLKSKDEEIENLKKELDSFSDVNETLSMYEEEKKVLTEQLNSLRLESSNFSVDLESKDKEIQRLNLELSKGKKSSENLNAVKQELSVAIGEKDLLLKRLSELENKYSNLDSSYSKLQETYESQSFELSSKVEELKSRLKNSDESLMESNKERLEMQSRIKLLEKSTDRDTDIEAIMSELTDLRLRYENLSTNVFSKISSYALPKSSSTVFLTRKGVMLDKTRFVFAGSTESRKGAYRCILDEIKSKPKTDRFLIIDVVSETSIDYVFEMKKVISGIEWFRKGGGVQQYLSETCLSNVQVLSPGLGYLNDTYFLTVDWEQRLTELENSGYNVIVYCGDLSNIVGRVFHESFADIGVSSVYVHGNAIGSRTIVSNLRGLSNSSKSTIYYYEFNKRMKRFYDIVQSSNKCEILSTLGG